MYNLTSEVRSCIYFVKLMNGMIMLLLPRQPQCAAITGVGDKFWSLYKVSLIFPIFTNRFQQNSSVRTLMEIRTVGAEFFRTDRTTDRHDEGNRWILQFLRTRSKEWHQATVIFITIAAKAQNLAYIFLSLLYVASESVSWGEYPDLWKRKQQEGVKLNEEFHNL